MKNNIKIKEPEITRWERFLEGLVNNGVDFSLMDRGSTISIYLDGSDFSINLHKNGKYEFD